MSGALGQETKQDGIFPKKDLSELTPNKGDSIGFYFHSHDTRTGDDGEFMIVEGLQLDLTGKTIEEIIETATPINFIPRLVLENKFNDGEFVPGNAYRLEKTVNRGDMVKGKKVKYFAWDLFKIGAPKDAIDGFNKKILDLQGKGSALGGEQEAPAEKPSKTAAKI